MGVTVDAKATKAVIIALLTKPIEEKKEVEKSEENQTVVGEPETKEPEAEKAETKKAIVAKKAPAKGKKGRVEVVAEEGTPEVVVTPVKTTRGRRVAKAAAGEDTTLGNTSEEKVSAGSHEISEN